MATIIKTVGASGRDYTTIAAALASIPANIVASGNNYVIELYKDQIYPAFSIAGFTADATHNIKICPGPGQGYQDASGFLTGPLRYDPAKGATVQASAGYNTVIRCSTPYTVLDGLQVYNTAAPGEVILFEDSGSNSTVSNCIVQFTGEGLAAIKVNQNGKAFNNTVIASVGNNVGITAVFANSVIANNTIVALTPGNGRGAVIEYGNTTDCIIRNNAIFGYATPITSAGAIATDGHNATDAASIAAGAGDVGSLVGLSLAAQFENITSLAAADLRLKSTSVLRDSGASFALSATSINKQTRSQQGSGYDIGAWEFSVPLTVPDAPTAVVATPGNGVVSVAFQAPAFNGGSAITGYSVLLSTGQTGSGESSPIVVAAPNGTPVTATVKAINAQGSSVASSPSNSVTPFLDSAAPVYVSSTTNTAGTEITFTLNEACVGDPPSAAAFQLAGRAYNVVFAGGMPKLTNITPAINGSETITSGYIQPTNNALADASGNKVESFGPVTVTNIAPNRPMLPGYVVKVYGDSEIADFTTPAALSTFITGLNCIDLATKFMIYLDKNLDASGRSFGPAFSNETYFVTMRPMPGKSFDELEPDNAPGAIGTLGIDVIVNNTTFNQGVLLESLRFKSSSANTAINTSRNNHQGDGGGMRGCRIHQTGSGKTIMGGWGGMSATFSDNLFVVDGANTQAIIEDQGFCHYQRNTFVRLNGAVGYQAIIITYGARNNFDNVYAGCGGAPVGAGTSATSNGFTNTPITGSTVGMTYVSGALFASASDYRPAAGSVLIGAGSQGSVSVNDNNGNNRGPSPDVGAFQCTPSIPLAIGSVTSQVLDGEFLTINMTISRSPTSGSMTLLPANPANGAQTVGPIPVVLNGSTATVSTEVIPPGDYQSPVITLSNAGGVNGVTGTSPFSIMGIENLVYDTGGVGAGGGGTEPVDPTLPAPVVTIATAAGNIVAGKTASLSGTVSLQGDANGTVSTFLEPQPSGTAIDFGQANVVSGTWAKTGTVTPGLYMVRIDATANGQTVSVRTGTFRVLNLVGNFNLPA